MIIKKRRAGAELCFPPAKKPAISKPSLDHQRPNLKMDVAATYCPKPIPGKPLGEDSFICARRNIIGIADGVSGWIRKGIDAGQYARELMQNAAFYALRQPRESVNPRTVLDEAFHETKSQGSSTACIAALKQNPKKQYLHAVNVGDSGFMLFRDNKLVFRSPTQPHEFNRPYRLGNSKNSDTLEKAEEFKVEVKAGDIVVFGTDGVFDNVYAREFERYIESSCCEGDDKVTPEELAWLIAEVAECNSRNEHGETPFSEASRKAGKKFTGGKIGDITVLVAYIVPR
ncbi:probable protein phosphatase 2C 55 [Prosopis cineraria]|uniref:probable protein phosphatase 2C 55 n=1 Tax=Prosopis cineraria TaxID=364024 RepID=UPI00240FF420|nr:probable protein phosphatase 2C 55 [Prosopis cineraria]